VRIFPVTVPAENPGNPAAKKIAVDSSFQLTTLPGRRVSRPIREASRPPGPDRKRELETRIGNASCDY